MLSDCSRYQPLASWHQVQKAVDMQVSPTAAMASTAAAMLGRGEWAARWWENSPAAPKARMAWAGYRSSWSI